jgi:hypothetical protein
MWLGRLNVEEARTVALRAATWTDGAGAKIWAVRTLLNYLIRRETIEVPDELAGRHRRHRPDQATDGAAALRPCQVSRGGRHLLRRPRRCAYNGAAAGDVTKRRT